MEEMEMCEHKGQDVERTEELEPGMEERAEELEPGMEERAEELEPGMEELGPEARVEEDRITLVDDKDEEYDFIIVDQFALEGREYLALVSCDEKTDMGSGDDPGEANDITVVRVEETGEQRILYAVKDADELLKVAKVVEERFGHLSEQDG